MEELCTSLHLATVLDNNHAVSPPPNTIHVSNHFLQQREKKLLGLRTSI